ncbi:glycosyltransferase, partial [Campylobacter jejuni]|nr:glycosyltransferase [Campylobacter jejuni]
MQQPLVSVIIPIYNVEKYLRECLDSVVNQTLREIEIILINDGSTDSCGKICDEYATKDKRIIVIHKENAGLGAAYNSGL